MTKVKAVIFDVDGLMFETEKVGKIFFEKLNKKYCLKIDESFRQSMCGKKESVIREELKQKFPNFDVDQYRDEWINACQNHFIKYGAKAKKGLKNILKFLISKNIKIAVASGSPKFHIENIFNKANIDMNIFDAVVCADDKVKSKPNPEIMLKVCEKINEKPKNVVVLEDAINGIISAKKAGCLAFMIPDLIQPNNEMREISDKILTNLNEAKKEIEKLI